MKKLVSVLSLLTFCTGMAFARDIKTVVITTHPQMHCINCETKIKKNLRFEKGIKDITTSVPDQTVTIKYDAQKTTVEKLIKAFEKFGYTARELKKNEKVQLDCSTNGCKM